MKRVIVREATKSKTEAALKAKGVDVTVLWDTAYCNNGDVNTHVKTVCNVCGGIEDFFLVSLTRGAHRCDSCLIRKYTNACKKLNLKFISKFSNRNVSSTMINTECLICGNLSVISSANLIDGNFSCDGCRVNRYAAALRKKNCELTRIEKRVKRRTLLHYKNSNGDCFSASAFNVIGGKFETSLDGCWSQPHCVYLIKLKIDSSTTIYKIGTANDPHKRAKNLKLNKDYQVFTIASFETRYEADKLESELHKEFSDYRLPKHISSEYTGGFTSKRGSDGKYFKVKDGITEWFSSEVFSVLKNRYKLHN